MRFAEAVRQAEIVMRSLGEGQALYITTMRMGVLHQVIIDCTRQQRLAQVFQVTE